LVQRGPHARSTNRFACDLLDAISVEKKAGCG